MAKSGYEGRGRLLLLSWTEESLVGGGKIRAIAS